MHRFSHTLRILPCALIVCAMIAGCTLWSEREDQPQAKWKDVFGTDGPQIVDARKSPIETVILEVAHVEQPLNDLSMIDLLWKEIDQIGALDAKTRRELEQNGIRIGISGPNPPRLLESIKEADSRWRRERTEGKFGSNEQLVTIFPGQPTTLFTGDPYQKVSIEIPRGSHLEKTDYYNARCQFRVEAETLQEGWVRLTFIPEIHHGEQKNRRVATEEGWQYQQGQTIDTIFSQQFTITLNQGEMALLSATESRPESMGHAYFIGDGHDDQMQRVVMIRLAEIRSARQKLERER